MIVLRSLLSVLLLAALLAPSTARAGEEEDQAALFVNVFGLMCPGLLAESLGGENMFGAADGPLATGISGETCGCIDSRLKAMSAREITRMMESDEASGSVEAMFTGCMVRALKPRVGEVCGFAAQREGAAKDDPLMASTCGCAQKRADAMSEEEMAALFDSEDKDAADALFAGCEPEA